LHKSNQDDIEKIGLFLYADIVDKVPVKILNRDTEKSAISAMS